ncbi:MAG: ABC transporter ATP-binding protein [Armatimonadota bacterium]|nr:ABC transporter ATP-binding protein [Armatimonadota bacterium]MDR7453379.1 ABC transporter ATP-binding protein [Armatimonadota bacterium]MDR7457198.1 ABC transporter ATP-binding protein [Armatimonadota bacterium]MDR7496061.1 ABC transporter ATP-binding protein [Armatimonadota bacterium]MDR7512049.1 ABC transporter ATP-binding protein [Armatimonadota bacterium]
MNVTAARTGGPSPLEVELRDLHRRFGDTAAVRDLTLTIGPGEFFTFLGPSGCGKTTTLRMIAGLLLPDAGEILFDGRPVTTTPPWRRDIGMVFQNYALWPHMTVFENVGFGLVERRVPRDELRRRVDDALRLVGLEGLEHRLPSQLSGGQQQRVALARAIVVRPRLLLLDEPLSNLDARLRVQMRAELVTLQRHLGITTIYVTHDQEEALMLSTRIAVLHQGRLVQLGTPRDLYEHPADVFVADFLGGANFLPGTVRGRTGDALVVALDAGNGVATAELHASASRHTEFEAGDRVTVCVRPEALELVPDRGPAGPNLLRGRLRLVNYLGAVMSSEVELPEGRVLRVQVVRPPTDMPLVEGAPVALRVAPEAVLLLRPPASP